MALAIFKNSSMEYLGYPQFAATFLLTVFLHICAGIAFYMSPHLKIIDIPVRAINIRLGDSDVQQQVVDEEDAPQPELNTSKQVDDAMTKLIRHPTAEKAIKKAVNPAIPHVNKPLDAPAPKTIVINDKIDTPRQFVRFNDVPDAAKDKGSVLGNSTDNSAEVTSIYTQSISLWILKFKVYPESQRAAGVQGHTLVRIRIDRRGNVRYSALENSTGNIELDRAVLDMVRRANPVPAPPDSYPGGDLLEFLVKVNFEDKG